MRENESAYPAQFLGLTFIQLFKVITWIQNSSSYSGVFWFSLYIYTNPWRRFRLSVNSSISHQISLFIQTHEEGLDYLYTPVYLIRSLYLLFYKPGEGLGYLYTPVYLIRSLYLLFYKPGEDLNYLFIYTNPWNRFKLSVFSSISHQISLFTFIQTHEEGLDYL